MTTAATDPDRALQVRLTLWHPDCWVLNVTDEVAVGLVGFGLFAGHDGRATTRYTVYGEDQATIDEGIRVLREHPAVYDVVPMTTGYQGPGTVAPGNATRDLLVENDPTKLISEAFTARGFTYAEPCEIYDNREHWTLYAPADRETLGTHLDEIREQEDATIDVRSITSVTPTDRRDPLPIDRLSRRQREVFQLARDRGYYRQPTAATAEELAAELDVTPSTFHEHLHKAEEKVLDRSTDGIRGF